jgi:hypothetical protein
LFNDNGKHFIELDDIKGNKIRSFDAIGKQARIPGNDLAADIYIVKFYDANRQFISSAKIIVQK